MTLNFTVGPVQSEAYICTIGSEQVPYFRNNEFSNIIFESETIIKKLVNAEEQSKVVFITGSGTASMEAAIINTFNSQDKLIVINGGTFGSRFVEICKTYNLQCIEIPLAFGQPLTKEDLEKHYEPGITGLLINVDETSSGVLYDMSIVSNFCKKHNIILIADIISSFLADENDMRKDCVDVYIIGSQKALACQPGVSILVLSERVIGRIMNNHPKAFYLDLKKALVNAERGQTPFTPAVGIIKQIYARLKKIENDGGAIKEIERVKANAIFIRTNMADLPFERVTERSSNAVTAYYTKQISAQKIIAEMKDKYDIWICPNGGEYSNTVFRIGHIGNLGEPENNYLIESMKKVVKSLRN